MLKKYELVEIKNIKEKDNKKRVVYDLQVEGDFSYNAEGVIVHNSVCSTKNKTAVYRPMFDAVKECSKLASIPVIADGGIVEHGDIAKAIAAGATMVMAGHLFAGYEQSAGSVIEIEDRMYKEYYGSASKYNKEEQKNIEGKKTLIQYRGDMNRLLRELKEDLQSSISYVGATSIEGLKGSNFYIINK